MGDRRHRRNPAPAGQKRPDLGTPVIAGIARDWERPQAANLKFANLSNYPITKFLAAFTSVAVKSKPIRDILCLHAHRLPESGIAH